MKITLIEARELYKQGGMAKEIALREYSEGEILNDYTLITELPYEVTYNPTTDLYAMLYTVYRKMSKGRPLELTKNIHYYRPEITISSENYKPHYGIYAGKVKIDNSIYSVYICTTRTMWCGRLGWENDGVYCGCGILENRWLFKEEAQAKHFVKHFYKELIRFELGDFYTVNFIEQ